MGLQAMDTANPDLLHDEEHLAVSPAMENLERRTRLLRGEAAP
jgi:hypothetical protein